MSTSPRLGVFYVGNGVLGAEVLYNDAVNKIEAAIALSVEDFDLDTPPGSPTNGQMWTVGSAPTGAWSGNADEIAVYVEGWQFFPPWDGLTLWDKSVAARRICTDASTDSWTLLEVTTIADASVSSVSGSGADSTINSNFTELETKVNDILTALQDLGLMA